MTNQNRFLCFNLGTEEFAIPLLNVKEVIGIPDTTPVPQAPSYLVGIMNLRGEVLSIIDLRTKLGIAAQFTGETATIILEAGAFKIGVIVEGINSVQTFTPESITEKPTFDGPSSKDYILGVVRKDEKLILLLDVFQVLSLEDKGVVSIKKSVAA